MRSSTILLLSLIVLSAVLIGVLVARPVVTATRGGKILAFFILFLLPSLSMTMGVSSELERSKSTEFCLSCHVMESHGRSLYVDDPGYLAAAHFQNHRVPADQACYTCHTRYAMFGGSRAKLNGLHHVYVQYFGKAQDPIRLYEPYNNRECLHCHLGARSFEEGVVHTADPDLLPAVKANKVSCLSSGCHDVVHNAGQLSNVKFWKGAK
jgi:nitrate/TMAO reductase-like tetraheme cytochrome c subunit